MGNGHDGSIPLLEHRIAAPGHGDGVETERACFLHRYEPDQVPRVCGLGHTLSAYALPGGGYEVVGGVYTARAAGTVARSHSTAPASTSACSGS